MAGIPDFTSIRISTLRGDIKIPFDVHIKVAEKMILYCRRGDSFEGDRLERLKAKKLKALFIKKSDEIPYKQYLEESIDTAYNAATGKSLYLRAEVIQGFQQAAAEEFMENPLDNFAYDHVKSSVQRFIAFIEKEKGAVAAFLAIPNSDRSITHHGVNVAALSTAMAQAEDIKDPKTIALMALGALLHDTEHFYSGFDVSGNPSSYSPEALEVYKKHPLEGAHRLQGSKFLDQLVLKIIMQHEEHIDGGGFPQGLLEKAMDPMVLIVGTANAYDRLVSFENIEPRAALKSLLIDKLGAFPLKQLQTLQEILKSQQVV